MSTAVASCCCCYYPSQHKYEDMSHKLKTAHTGAALVVQLTRGLLYDNVICRIYTRMDTYSAMVKCELLPSWLADSKNRCHAHHCSPKTSIL